MQPRVGLFITCLADLVRPAVGFAAARLIEAAGCVVEVPRQTCCGQPAYNSGDRVDAKRIAATTMEAFADFDYVVAPSGSCAAMLKLHYPALFDDDPELSRKAKAFSSRVHELTSFLADVRGVTSTGGTFQGRVTYHDSCSGLRELGISDAPRKLLSTVAGLELCELEERETCCGFGGLFSVKYPEISTAMADKKVQSIKATGADLVVGGDLGCLMNIAGRLSRSGTRIACRHVAEVLAGELDAPPIGLAAGQ